MVGQFKTIHVLRKQTETWILEVILFKVQHILHILTPVFPHWNWTSFYEERKSVRIRCKSHVYFDCRTIKLTGGAVLMLTVFLLLRLDLRTGIWQPKPQGILSTTFICTLHYIKETELKFFGVSFHNFVRSVLYNSTQWSRLQLASSCILLFFSWGEKRILSRLNDEIDWIKNRCTC